MSGTNGKRPLHRFVSIDDELVGSSSSCNFDVAEVGNMSGQRPMVVSPQSSTVDLSSVASSSYSTVGVTRTQPTRSQASQAVAVGNKTNSDMPLVASTLSRPGHAVSHYVGSPCPTSTGGSSRLYSALLLTLFLIGIFRVTMHSDIGGGQHRVYGPAMTSIILHDSNATSIVGGAWDDDRHETVYVPGGGFSGFWFTLGRLKSISDPKKKNYYCFSAGCLGVVATMNNFTMEEMWDRAFGVQNMWKNGEIGRYQVVEKFLDSLLFDPTKGNISSNLPLSRLNIITSDTSGWFLKPSIRTPTTLSELHEMLLQTTWIPFATGGDLVYKGHMDGAFTIAQHPTCDHDVGLALDIDMYSNVVNVNLARSKVEKFWMAGLAKGL